MAIKISGETRLIPIIGDPIIYAKSPDWLSEDFARQGHKEVCVPMQVAANDLERVLNGLTSVPNVAGLLVTMPHKKAIFGYCATTSDRSRLLQTVSVMRRNANGSWHGDVLDGNSFVKAQIDQGARPAGARALLLGAGGAGSAIGVALLEAGVLELIVHDIDEVRGTQLASVLATLGLGHVRTGSSDPTGCNMVCNATPLGMADGDPLPLDPGLLRPTMFVGDVIAGHGDSALMLAARSAGCKTANGEQMVTSVLGLTIDFFVQGS